LAVEQASHATFEVIVRPLTGLPGTEAKSLSSAIRSVLTPSLLLSQNPRTLIQLVIQSVTPTISHRFPLSLVASLINASTLALLNAGSVPMRGVVCAVAVGRMRPPVAKPKQAVTLILDPNDRELSTLEGGGCFAFLFAVGVNQAGAEESNVVSEPKAPCEAVWSNWHATTTFHDDELVRARELAKMGAERVWLKMKESLGWMEAISPLNKSIVY
jgi:exosome complex component RRP46